LNQSSDKAQDVIRGERLAEVRKARGLTIPGMAAIGGVSKGSQMLYEKGSAPSADYLAAIDSSDFDVLYILTGVGSGKGFNERLRDQHSEPVSRPSLTPLPIYDVQASAGTGIVSSDRPESSVIYLEPEYLRQLGANPAECSVIAAKGDSMDPTIPDGSMLVIDHSQSEIRDGCIYVLNVSGDLLVKRVQRDVVDANKIKLRSDNKRYKTQTITERDMADLRVIGRVVYYCRTP